MRMLTHSRKLALSAIAITTVLSLALGTISLRSFSVEAASSPLRTLAHSAAPWTKYAQRVGAHNSTDQITVGLLLRTSQPAQQQALLKSLYNPKSSNYHHWLSTGEFQQHFAPSASAVTAAQSYMKQQGLQLVPSPDQTLILAQGTTKQLEAAFHTSINDYHLKDGSTHFANSTDIQLPGTLLDASIGVFGLSNMNIYKPNMKIAKRTSPNTPPPSYGAGPHGSGLTPSQIAGIYNANKAYSKLHDTGQGTTLAVYEMSDYKASDIIRYERQYHLKHVKIVNKSIFGGPQTHDGAAEVELDIELQIAMAPGIKKLIVYESPNTELGGLEQFLQMAHDNSADAISSSWGVPCELVLSPQAPTSEDQIFLQMAFQGQSLFIASGDSGAFGCSFLDVHIDMPFALQIGGPSDQPYATAVGGTSFYSQNDGILFDPGEDAHPSYPGTSKEITWIRKPCSNDSCDGGGSGGGVSHLWAEPDYAFNSLFNGLPGVVEDGYSQYFIYCSLTAVALCRQTPDVSLNADPSTGYSIYCTDHGDANCATGEFTPKPGWLRAGGTSCAAPLWAGIAALAIQHDDNDRQGLFNYLLYPLDSVFGYSHQLHDITIGDNGYYPAGPNYDMATGLGTADIYQLVKRIY